jgi:hypothetical protein
MADKKKPDFNNLQMPPLWTGVAGQGKDQIFSLGGKWHKVGDTVGDGYQVLGMDKTGGLALSWNGLPISMKLQQGTVTPMQQEQAPTFSTIAGMGALSSQEEEMMKNIGNALQDDKSQDPDAYKYNGVVPEIMDKIRENSKQSPHMTDEDKKNIIHYGDWMKGMKDGTIKEGVKYFVPALQEDGNIDFHIFMREPKQTIM